MLNDPNTLNALERDDLVSRAGAIDALNDTLVDYLPILIGPTEEIPLKCARAIYNLPSAGPQRMRGRWIESNLIPSRKGKPGGRLFICSECNKGWIKQDRSMEEINFCPNCGADMRGEQDAITD